MAMKPFNEVTYSQKISTGSLPSNFNVQNVIVAQRVLSNIITRTGNFVTPNPHAYVSTRWRGLVGSETHTQFNNWQKVERARGTSWPYSSYWISADSTSYNLAVSKLYEALRGSVDVSVDLVQWKKTLEMVSLYRRFVRGIAHQAKKLIPRIENVERIKRELADPVIRRKRGKRLARELNSALNVLAFTRLEYVYGWKPTASTIYDLAQGVLVTEKPGLLKVEGKGKQKVERIRDTGRFLNSSVPHIWSTSLSARTNIICYYNPVPSVMDNLSRITSLNPVSILYEATPFSFVLDWGWNVSQWLRSLETAFTHRNDFVSGQVTTVTRSLVEVNIRGVYDQYPKNPGLVYSRYDWQGTAVRTTFSRMILSSAPYPTRPVKAQSFGIEKQLNAIALAKAVFLSADEHLSKWRR